MHSMRAVRAVCKVQCLLINTALLQSVAKQSPSRQQRRVQNFKFLLTSVTEAVNEWRVNAPRSMLLMHPVDRSSNILISSNWTKYSRSWCSCINSPLQVSYVASKHALVAPSRTCMFQKKNETTHEACIYSSNLSHSWLVCFLNLNVRV